jgi:amino acid adenylation domain-containing protein
LSVILNLVPADLGQPGSVASRFREVVASSPGKLAVQGDDASYTYEALDRESSRIANALLDRLGPTSEPVAFLMPYGARMLAALIGIIKAGKFYVPLDSSYPDARNRAILEDIGARLLLTAGATVATGQRLALRPGEALDLDDLAGASPADPCLDLAEDAYAYVLYTSGTTGTPKGVIENHRDAMHIYRVTRDRMRISASSRVMLIAPLIFSGTTPWIFGSLLGGATLLTFDIRAHGTGAALAEWMQRQRITVASFVPSVFRNLGGYLASVGGRLDRLETLNLGSDRILASDFRLYQRLCHDACPLLIGFGMSEVKFICQFVAGKDTLIERDTMPIGFPYPGLELLLLDEQDRPVPQGTPGEMVVRTRFASPGYWGRPDLTARRFRREGELTVFYTGDRGMQDAAGCYHHLGRIDNQVKIRGNRVELGEVEACLMHLAGVRDALAVRHEDERGRELLVAYYLPEAGARPAASTLRAALRKLLPEYMVPAAYVPMDAFPVNENGKLDRRRLPPPSRREHRL